MARFISEDLGGEARTFDIDSPKRQLVRVGLVRDLPNLVVG